MERCYDSRRIATAAQGPCLRPRERSPHSPPRPPVARQPLRGDKIITERVAAPARPPIRVQVSETAPETPGRLASLDVFRGITIAGMLLVNNPGSWSAVYPPLRHAEWHGWTPTDLIFPFFLFIVGVSMSFSFARAWSRGVTRAALLVKAGKRSLILFGLGLVLHSFPWAGFDYSQLRIPGVLQRIAVAFLLAAAIVIFTGGRGRAAAITALLLGYWAAMRWVPVPGIGAGVWEPGRDLGAYLDRRIFGMDHLWAQSRTWDPEGALSTLPAVATVLIGIFAGEWLRSPRPAATRIRGMTAAGAVAIAAGLLWAGVFPINKPLWTSSYVLFTAGLALVSLGACYWIVDVKGRRRWAWPFLVFGVNAIAAFFLSSLTARVMGTVEIGGVPLKSLLHEALFGSWLGPLNASLAFALAYTGFWAAAMALFYRHRIFVKV